jgi:hypothetical protein
MREMKLKETRYLTSPSYHQRWFCYLDLLGFSNLVREDKLEIVVPTYERVLEALQQHTSNAENISISYSWFSDAFIVFSHRDTLREFHQVELIGRKFFLELLLARIPSRGALSHGRLYSQKQKNIFVGEALIDAYEYGEKQNWLGFLLSPTVSKGLSDMGALIEPSDRNNVLALYSQPPPEGVISHPRPDGVLAYAFRDVTDTIGAYLSVIDEMQKNAPETSRAKYDNVRFFVQHNSPVI